MTWAAFERQAYQAARDWGVQPSEFWAMSPAEWWAEADAKIREAREIKGEAPRVKWTAEEIERVKRGRKA